MRFLTVLLLICSFIPIKTVVGQQVVGGEYFVNSYVDFGKGNAFTLSTEVTDLELDVTSIPDGLNVLFLRTKNSEGVWSMTSKSVFYKYPAPQHAEAVEVEYFIDAYGNFGTGKKIAVKTGKDDYLIDLSGVQPGLHVLYTRVKNNVGKWSHVKSSAFFIADDELSKITSLRYQFIGVGFESEVLTFTDFEPATEVELSQDQFLANADGLEEGKDYKIKIIATNEKGQQSLIYTAAFTYVKKTPVSIAEVQVTSTNCFGSEDGKATIMGIGEGLELEYSLDNVTFQALGLFEDLAPGTYMAYARDKDDTDNLVEKTFEISSPTEIQVSISGIIQPSCPGDENGGFTVNATGGVGSFTYKLSTQTAFQSGNQFTDLPAGEYTLTVRDGNGCEKTRPIQINTQNQNPSVPTLTVQGTDGISTEVQLLSSSTTGNQWLRNGEEIPGATGQSLEITQSGNYQVKVTAASGCSATSATTVITSHANGEIRTGNPTTLFPNPAKDQVTLKFEREFYLDKITIINSQGISINRLDIQRMTDEVTIDVTGMSPGKYILLVEGIGMQERLNLIKR